MHAWKGTIIFFLLLSVPFCWLCQHDSFGIHQWKRCNKIVKPQGSRPVLLKKPPIMLSIPFPRKIVTQAGSRPAPLQIGPRLAPLQIGPRPPPKPVKQRQRMYLDHFIYFIISLFINFKKMKT